MTLCKKPEIPPPHTQMSTSQAGSAHVIHKFNRQLSLFKLYLYSLAYPRNCNQGNFAICLFLEYLFLFSTPSTSMEVFPIMRFLSCERWGLHRKNSVGCVFIINRPIKGGAVEEQNGCPLKIPYHLCSTKEMRSLNPGPVHTLLSAHKHWGPLGRTLLLFLLGLYYKAHCVKETHGNKRVDGRNWCWVLL